MSGSISTGSGRRSRIGQERTVTIVSLLEQMDFLFVDDDELVIDEDAVGAARGDRPGRASCSTPSIAHLAECEWTVEASTCARRSMRHGFEKPRKVMPALYTAVEGRPRGSPAVRLDGAARTRVVARASSVGASPAG